MGSRLLFFDSDVLQTRLFVRHFHFGIDRILDANIVVTISSFMDRLIEFEKTRKDVLAAIHEKNLFREEGLSGPISLTDALRMDMTSLAEGSGKIGWPATAWWWFVNVASRFYFPLILLSFRISTDPLGKAILKLYYQKTKKSTFEAIPFLKCLL